MYFLFEESGIFLAIYIIYILYIILGKLIVIGDVCQ